MTRHRLYFLLTADFEQYWAQILQRHLTIMILPRGYRAVNSDISPAFVKELTNENRKFIFTSTAFVSKIRRFYRQLGELNPQRKRGSRERTLCCKFAGWIRDATKTFLTNTHILRAYDFLPSSPFLLAQLWEYSSIASFISRYHYC